MLNTLSTDSVRRLGLVFLAGLVLVLPLAHLAAWRSIFLLGVIVCSLFCLGQDNRQNLTFPPLGWIFLLWMVAALNSLPDGPERKDIILLALNEVGKSTLVFYCAYLLSLGAGAGFIIYWGAILALSLLSGVVLVSWGIHGGWVSQGIVPPLGDYATSALTLLPLVALPLFNSWRRSLGTWAMPSTALCLLLTVGGGVVTMSQSVWLVWGIMQAVVLALLFGKYSRNWYRGLLWGGGSGVVLLTIAWLVARWRGTDLLFFEARKVIYVPVFQHILESPWTGFGYGHESARAWYLEHMTEPGISHAHNLLLSYAEQMGVLGVLTVFAIFGGLLYRFLKGMGQHDSYTVAPAVLGAALVAGVFVKNNLDIFFVRHNLLLFFICAGMLLGLLEGGAREVGEGQSS